MSLRVPSQIDRMLQFNPEARVTAAEALAHPYFSSLKNSLTQVHIFVIFFCAQLLIRQTPQPYDVPVFAEGEDDPTESVESCRNKIYEEIATTALNIVQ